MLNKPARVAARILDDLLIVIPARVSSRRYPGKALALVSGKPVIWHVVCRAIEAQRGRVLVATDAQAIADAVDGLCPVYVDDAPAATGTDRVARVLAAQQLHPRWVINLQGDEPCLPPQVLREFIDWFVVADASFASMAVPMMSLDGFHDPDVVKVILTDDAAARAFVRVGKPVDGGRWHQHVGVYGFTMDALRRFSGLPIGRLEQQERLEQLRVLEAGWRVDMFELTQWEDRPWPSVNRPADREAAEAYLHGRSVLALPVSGTHDAGRDPDDNVLSDRMNEIASEDIRTSLERTAANG